jgi:hypothetical protein
MIGCGVQRATQIEEITQTTVAGVDTTALSADGLFRLEIPAAAVPSGTVITITTFHRAIPSLVGASYKVGPAGLSFNVPVTAKETLPSPLVTPSQVGLALIDDGRATKPFGPVGVAPVEEIHAGLLSVSDAVYGYGAVDVGTPCAHSQCMDSCDFCDPSDPACTAALRAGVCDASGRCQTRAPSSCTLSNIAEGWDQAPGTGRAFIVNNFGIADQPSIGFDYDGRCRATGDCADNALAPLGELGNDQIRQGLLGGESLILIELAGLDEPYTGDDDSLTVKIYGARDADEPFFPANNFQIPAGETTCCEFKIRADYLSAAPPQARLRMPARIHSGLLEVVRPEDGEFVGLFPLTDSSTVPSVGAPSAVARAQASFRVKGNLQGLDQGLLGMVLPLAALAQIQNPYCNTVGDPLCPAIIPDSTILDLLISVAEPDVDLDVPPNGLDHLERDILGNGRVKKCTAGDGTPIPPISADAPWTCALNARDGFSIAYELSAVPAHIVGVSF